MKKILLALSFVCLSELNAQTYVTIPDANFVTWLQSNVPSAMSGNQMNTSSAAVTTRDSINVASKFITNLSGIQYFTSLTYLNCFDNRLINLPTLPNALKFLDCASDSLTALPALPNSLVYLDCNGNYLTTLPVLPNSLTSLVCYYNNLTNLPTLPNLLTSLLCSNNNISCFPTFPDSLINFSINPNPYNCLPNYVLPTMNSYTTTPLCSAGNTHGCPVATGIEQEASINNRILLYPNPSFENVNISSTQNIEEIKITDMLGQIVYENKPNEEKIKLQIEKNGIYFITITSNKQITIRKLIVSK